jgi:hypothetical protein
VDEGDAAGGGLGDGSGVDNDKDSVYDLIYGNDEAGDDNNNTNVRSRGVDDDEGSGTKQQLVLLGSYPLMGVIEQIEVVHYPRCSQDFLFLAFGDAKLSMVKYDVIANDIVVIPPLHYFEPSVPFSASHNAITFGEDVAKPILRIDPLQTCAVFIAYNKQVTIIPFRAEYDGVTCRDPTHQARTFDLAEDFHTNNLIDATFLDNYYDPTLCLLSEPKTTWSGRIPHRHNTCAISVISINLTNMQHTTIWYIMSFLALLPFFVFVFFLFIYQLIFFLSLSLSLSLGLCG